MSDPLSQLRREVRTLRLLVALCAGALLLVAAAAFRAPDQPARFEVIDVQRINVREPDGKLRLVISNKARSDGPISRGKPFAYPGGERPGLIFFNDEESESGGLTFGGRRAGGRPDAAALLSFDQYDSDQVVVLQYVDDSAGGRSTGLRFVDRADVPVTEIARLSDSVARLPAAARASAERRVFGPRDGVPLAATRLYVGRDPSRSAVVRLADPQGRTKLRLLVDSLGAARIEFLDDSGRVIQRLPAAAAADTGRRPGR